MSSDPQRIVAILPNWIGDAAMCTPALRALYRRFPSAKIFAAGPPPICDLVRGLPSVSEPATLPRRASIAGLREAAARLHPIEADLAVVFPHSFRAALIARLAGAKRRLGYARDGRSFLLTDAVPPYRENGRITPLYMAREYLELVARLGCEDDDLGLELTAEPAVVEEVRAALPSGEGPLVGISPGAAFGPSKLWPPERFAKVADTLAKQIGARCLLLTGPGEEPTRDAVLAAAKSALTVLDPQRASIARLKATISQLDLLICNDSGPRHIAVAFKVPVVCLMGPTSPRYSNGPYEKGEVLRVPVYCGPCQQPTCATDHRCMTRISAEWVTRIAKKYLRHV